MTKLPTPDDDVIRGTFTKFFASRGHEESQVEAAFDRWINERDAKLRMAAEQRGAEKTLWALADSLGDNSPEARYANDYICEAADLIANEEIIVLLLKHPAEVASSQRLLMRKIDEAFEQAFESATNLSSRHESFAGETLESLAKSWLQQYNQGRRV